MELLVTYRAVLFDLFDTLVRFDRTRLPVVHVNGRRLHSTAGHLHEIFRAQAPEVDLPAFVEALLWSWEEAERIRAVDHREVCAPERFGLLFRRLKIDPESIAPAVLTALLDTHRRELSKAADFPAHHGPLLRRLARDYRLAVVSNFDYSPTATGILENAGVAEVFGAIVVSDEVGWRKPKPVIFEEACRRLGIAPTQALFVGDRADIDVVGAHAVGMDAAWINPGAEPLPPGLPPPRFEIRDLAELGGILSSERPAGRR
jgi:HAD superfamily hydrolase (TIGR01549 family)